MDSLQKVDTNEIKENVYKLLKESNRIPLQNFSTKYNELFGYPLAISIEQLCIEMSSVSIQSEENNSFLVYNEKANENNFDGDSVSNFEDNFENSENFSLTDAEIESEKDVEEGCYYCKKSGHSPFDCKERKADNPVEKNNSFNQKDTNERKENRHENDKQVLRESPHRDRRNYNRNDGNSYGDSDLKKKECWAFKANNCRFGENCRFSHDSQALNQQDGHKNNAGSRRRKENFDEIKRANRRNRKPSFSSESSVYSSSSGVHKKSGRSSLEDQIKILELKVEIKRLASKLRRRDREISNLKKEIRRIR